MRTITELMSESASVTATEGDATSASSTTALAWDSEINDREPLGDGGAALLDALDAINPKGLSYDDWLKVGQALHHEGQPCDVWESWSRPDAERFKPDECRKKWRGFGHEAGPPVTGGTIVYLAEQAGWTRPTRERRRSTAKPTKTKGATQGDEGTGEADKPLLPPWESVRASDPPKRSPVLIDGLLRRGHVALLAGKAKSGKSWAGIRLGCAVATGGEWFGRRCERGRVLFIDPELDKRSLDNRFHAVCAAAGIDAGEVDGAVVKWSLRGVDGASVSAVAHDVGLRCSFGDFALVIVDSVSALSDGDENAASDVRRLFNQLLRVAAITGAAIVAIHHYGKSQPGDRDAADRARGSSVWADAPDATLFLTEAFPPSGEPSDYLAEGERAFLLEAGGVREFAAPEPARVIFSFPLHRIDTEGITEGWKPKSAASQGGRKAAESNKARSEGRADACMMALAAEFMERGDACEGIPAGEAAEICGEALGQPVNPQTLKKYVNASAMFDVGQVAKNRWQVVRRERDEATK